MESAIKIEQLTKAFAERMVLDHISFEVKVGQVHGFLGPNGAGKSTTMKILSGILAPSSGNISILGLTLDKNLDEIKKQIGILPENPPLYSDMKVVDYLKLALDLRQIKGTTHLDYALEKTGLTDVKNRLIGNLSKGFKQRVGVAQAIVTKPKIIILDEPTVGLDPASILEMRSLIRSLAPEHTVIYSSHLLHEVALTCTHISIIHKGKIVSSGALNEIEQRFVVGKKIRFELSNIHQSLIEGIKKFSYVKEALVDGQQLFLHLTGKEERRPELLRYMLEQKVDVLEMVSEKHDLEDIFLELTKEGTKV
ncbi:MAG: ABC transporter ATP-binding protein [Bacteriovoracaceae bacterium]